MRVKRSLSTTAYVTELAIIYVNVHMYAVPWMLRIIATTRPVSKAKSELVAHALIEAMHFALELLLQCIRSW